MTEARGRCYGVGVGPGDPELLTLKAARLLGACPVIASLSAVGRPSNARTVVAAHLTSAHVELPLAYPVTTEALPEGVSYETLLRDFYDDAAKQIAEHLDEGRDVAVLCEGDPLFFGSFMYVHSRLADRYEVEVVPGVTSFLGAASLLQSPVVSLNEVFTVLSGVLPEDELVQRLGRADAFAIMKVGRNLAKVRRAVDAAGLGARAVYVERATMATQRVLPLADADPATAPYFSIVLIPSATAPAPLTGSLVVVGLGPGDPSLRAPAAVAALAAATDLFGYGPYLAQLDGFDDVTATRHVSDNREEADRAVAALEVARTGARVAVVSSGDPGIFAMAAAVFEQIAAAPGRWDSVEVRVVPGITAASAVAASIGAPLGHDFAVISLSDNLKPWAVIERRLDAAASADFVLALYNPISRTRPWQLGRAIEIVGQHRAGATPVVLGRDVSRGGGSSRVVRLDAIPLDEVNMRTTLIIGSSTTHTFRHRGETRVLTPRSYPGP